METRPQGEILFSGIFALIAVVVVIQLWLLAASVDALLGGDLGVLLPAGLASLVLFGLNAALLRRGLAFDHELRRDRG